MTYMLPVAELLSVGREPLERSIWANLRAGKSSSVTEPFILSPCQQKEHQRKQTRASKPLDTSIMDRMPFIFNVCDRGERGGGQRAGVTETTHA